MLSVQNKNTSKVLDLLSHLQAADLAKSKGGFFNGEMVDKDWAAENVPLAKTQVIRREVTQVCFTQYFSKQASKE